MPNKIAMVSIILILLFVLGENGAGIFVPSPRI